MTSIKYIMLDSISKLRKNILPDIVKRLSLSFLAEILALLNLVN